MATLVSAALLAAAIVVAWSGLPFGTPCPSQQWYAAATQEAVAVAGGKTKDDLSDFLLVDCDGAVFGVIAEFQDDRGESTVGADVAARAGQRGWQQRDSHCWTMPLSDVKSYLTAQLIRSQRTPPRYEIFVSPEPCGG